MRTLFFLCLPLLLTAQQKDKLHRLDLTDQAFELTGLSFNVTEVADSTRQPNGTYGRVYTGMMNRARDLGFEHSLTMNLQASLLRQITDRDLPQATLIIYGLRIDEEIGYSSERRRLQLSAGLKRLDENGQEEYYGPHTIADVEGGLDMTSGHDRALAEALSEVLHQLDADVQAGRTTSASLRTFAPMPAHLPNGAYQSFMDFRAGQVDTSVHLVPVKQLRLGVLMDLNFHTVAFATKGDTRGKERRQVWGYHYNGQHFVQLQGDFYELQRTLSGQILVMVPRGLLDAEQLTKNAVLGGLLGGAVGGVIAASATGSRDEEDLFALDLNRGDLNPYTVEEKLPQVAGRIVLHYRAPLHLPPLWVLLDDGYITVRPDEYLLFDHPGPIMVQVAQADDTTIEFELSRQTDRPSVYQVTTYDGEQLQDKAVHRRAAWDIKEAIEAGRLRAAY